MSYYPTWPLIATTHAMTPWYYNLGPFLLPTFAPIDWSPPKGERIGGIPPWQGGHLLERAT